MTSREQANEVADTILADARQKNAKRRSGKLHFYFGAILTRKEIEALGADAELIRAAVRHAHSQWRLKLAFGAFIGLLLASVVFDGQFSLALYVFLLGGIYGLRSLTRKLVLEYLGQLVHGREGPQENGSTQPPPA